MRLPKVECNALVNQASFFLTEVLLEIGRVSVTLQLYFVIEITVLLFTYNFKFHKFSISITCFRNFSYQNIVKVFYRPVLKHIMVYFSFCANAWQSHALNKYQRFISLYMLTESCDNRDVFFYI